MSNMTRKFLHRDARYPSIQRIVGMPKHEGQPYRDQKAMELASKFREISKKFNRDDLAIKSMERKLAELMPGLKFSTLLELLKIEDTHYTVPYRACQEIGRRILTNLESTASPDFRVNEAKVLRAFANILEEGRANDVLRISMGRVLSLIATEQTKEVRS